MLRTDTGWVHSPADLVDLLECDLRATLALARACGLPGTPEPEPGGDRLAAVHGQAHEDAVLAALRATFGEDGVVTIGQPAPTPAALARAAGQTRAALATGVPVVYQGVFFDGSFTGRADFLIAADRDPATGAHRPGVAPGTYEPYDTKLARHARPAAVVQLTAYADALARAGFPLPPRMHLLLGDQSTVTLPVADFLPVLADLRTRLLARLAGPAALPTPAWGEERPACGTCAFAAHCAAGREQARDLSLLAGVRADQRRKLRGAGLDTLEALAAATDAQRPPTLSESTFTTLRAQARLQAAQDATRTAVDPTGTIRYEVVSADPLALLPEPSPGDLFFDMEGDPYALGNTGLEYLFGVVTLDGPTAATTQREAPSPAETFHAFWAHTRAQEKGAFEDFIDFTVARLAAHPGAHVYHYAPYEPSALKRLAAAHGTREAEVDQLLRTGALVDLYAVVRKGVRVSQRSYSIKYLEPLYMPSTRTGEVTTAASSIEAYEEYLSHLESGQDTLAAKVLAGIGDYNEYDCVSTHRLYRWLLGVRDEAGIGAAEPAEPALEEEAPDARALERAARLAAETALADRVAAGLPEQPEDWDETHRARHLLAGAVGYYRREANPAWWDFYAQAAAPLTDLEADPGCTVPVSWRAQAWAPPTGRQRKARRDLRASTDPNSPHPFGAGDGVRLLYPGSAARPAWTTDAVVAGAGAGHLDLTETAAPDATVERCPVAVLPGPPPSPRPKDAAVAALAEMVAATLPQLPDLAAVDFLRRRPPRLRGGAALPDPAAHGGDLVATVVAAVDALDGSYLAVQGPPGAGKSYLAGQLIAHLVTTGRTVGVCANSHKAVENVLAAALAADPDLAVAKRPSRHPDPAAAWDQPKANPDLARWRADHPGGHLIGGTAWQFASPDVTSAPLDVLIVDEAGQFALTDVLAVAGAATNLVLLGDPQQLPQVTVGTHPEGVDASALGHLLGEAEIIPAGLGYFLDQTRRMHPQVCAPVSALSYQGQLHAHPSTAARHVAGTDPGVHPVPVPHAGNTTASPEEAQAVTALVAAVVGQPFCDGEHTRALAPADVLVVAPYNRQVRLLARHLERAGLGEVRVGTVDKFQGQEAPVVLVSLTASSAAELPRGLEFLLNRNRLNVALSRAQVAAHLVCSPALTQAPVRTVADLRLLSGLLGLLAGPPGPAPTVAE